jgi:hypothetical protein
MSPTFFRKAKIPQKTKQNLYSLYTFDNQSILTNKGKIDKETGLIPVNVEIYQEILNLNVIKTSTCNIIFGLL